MLRIPGWIVASALFGVSSAFGAELSLPDLLRQAERNDHRISAEEMRESASDAEIDSARAGYYPRLDLEAVDSLGFPGSSGLTGVGGLMGSPYRKGIGAGAVAQWTVFDFGRTSHSVGFERHEAHAQKETTELTRRDIDLEAARLFFACVRARSSLENQDFILGEAKVISQEVSQFVRTGQRSVVERYLAESQVDETLTARMDAAKRRELVLRRLGLLVGRTQEGNDCPALDTLWALRTTAPEEGSEHPLLARAREEASAAEERVSSAQAGHLPRVVAVASVGMLQNTRLVPEKDYAVGLGVTLPIFDGLKTSSEVRRARALASARQFEVEASRERIADTNARYDEAIEAARARLDHIEHELELAREGFGVAKKRYFKFQGVLVDLREALRNLTRTEEAYDSTRLDWLEAETAKSIFNGRFAL